MHLVQPNLRAQTKYPDHVNAQPSESVIIDIRRCALSLLRYLPPPQMTDVKTLHRLIRFIGRLAVGSFFTEVRVIGGENVPKDGPILV